MKKLKLFLTLSFTVKMKVFVVHYTNFDYKPGHMSLNCDGVYTKWEDAFRAALENLVEMMWEDDEEKDEDIKCDDYIDKILSKLPTTQKELNALLPQRGCVWEFENGESAQWWDSEDIGARLTSISYETVRGN